MEIVYRALFMFAFLWFITRVVGRASLGELSTFELLLYITMGDLIQQAVTQQDYSVTAGVLAIGVFALLTIALAGVNSRWPRARTITHGIPVVIVTDGEPHLDILRREKLSLDDLMAAAREQGLHTFAAIHLAVLEADGKISFFTRHGESEGAPDRPPAGT